MKLHETSDHVQSNPKARSWIGVFLHEQAEDIRQRVWLNPLAVVAHADLNRHGQDFYIQPDVPAGAGVFGRIGQKIGKDLLHASVIDDDPDGL